MNKFGEFFCENFENSVVTLKNFNKLSDVQGAAKLAIFDLDHTLIKPKSFRIFPINDHDWRWVYQEVPDKLKKLDQKEYFVFVVSNQLGVSLNRVSKTMLCQRIANAFSNLEINICFLLAIRDDYYRKPSIGCFELIKCQFFGKDQQFDLKKSFFCGDSYKKTNQRSCADILFALNCNLQFKTPENIFLKQENLDMKQLNFYEPNKENFYVQNNIIKKKVIKYLDKDRICFVIIGAPFSGKTYLIKQTFDTDKKNIYFLKSGQEINQLTKIFEGEIDNKQTIYIEMSQSKKEKRKVVIDYIKNQKFKICGIHLKRNINFCLHLLSYRKSLKQNQQKIYSHPYMIQSYFENFQLPEKNEGYDVLIHTDQFLKSFANEEEDNHFNLKFINQLQNTIINNLAKFLCKNFQHKTNKNFRLKN